MSQASVINKRCQLVEARDDKGKREAYKCISNLKSKAEAEWVFVRKLVLGRHRRRGSAFDTWWRRVGPGKGRRPGATAFSNGQRYWNMYAFKSIILPVVGTSGYQGLE